MRSKKGFTLIELVVVMAIIAVLSLLIVGAIIAARNTSKETSNRASAKTIQTGLESLYSRTRAYNADPDGTGPLAAIAAGETCSAVATKLGVTTPPATTAGGGCTVSTIGADTYNINIFRADGTTIMELYQR